MILGNKNNTKENSFLESSIKTCLSYANEHDLSAYENGSYPIDGDRLFVNISEYETTSVQNRFWEAHKKYMDVHMVLCGEEQIDLNFTQNLQEKEFVEKNDFITLDGEKNSSVVLRESDFLICFPSDAHRTAIAPKEPQTIKKAVFKILLP